MWKLIKESLLVATVSSITSSIITIIIIHHWYSKNVSDVITNWITAIGTLLLAIFAWMAYKNYLAQKKEELLWNKKFGLLDEYFAVISKLLRESSEVTLEIKYVLSKDYPSIENLCLDSDKTNFLLYLFNVWHKNINNLLLIKLPLARDNAGQSSDKFASLGLLGFNLDYIKNHMSPYMAELTRGINQYVQRIRELKKLVTALEEYTKSSDSISYKETYTLLTQLELDPYKIKEIENSFNKLMEVGQKILNPKYLLKNKKVRL